MGHRGSGSALLGTSISPVYRLEEERPTQAYLQPSNSELIHFSSSLQDGVPDAGLPHNPIQELNDIRRLDRRFSPCFGQQDIQVIPPVRLGGSAVPVPRAPFWSVLVPPRIHQDSAPSPSFGPFQEYQNLGLFGRPGYHNLVQIPSQGPYVVGFQHAPTSGLSDQQRQVRFTTNPDPQHLGFYINTRKMIFTLPKDKVRELREATTLWTSTSTTIRRLASFISKAQAAMLAVLPARLKTRHLVACKDRALASGFRLVQQYPALQGGAQRYQLMAQPFASMDRTVIPPTDSGSGSTVV